VEDGARVTGTASDMLPDGRSQAAGGVPPIGRTRSAGGVLPTGRSQAAGGMLPAASPDAADVMVPAGRSEAVMALVNSPAPAHGRCPHCGTAVEGAADAFCCVGCAMAYEIIRGAGLERYYAERSEYAPRPEPVAGGWSAVPVETLPDGTCEARLMLDGLRCASCVWLVEHVLEATPGVTHAHVSYATGRATLRWKPAETALGSIASRVATLGYTPRALGEESRPDRGLMLRLGVAAFAAMNVMLLHASIYTGWLDPMDDRFLQLFRWTALVLSTPVAIWCASPFFAGAVSGVRNRVLHMDVPIALGVAILYGHGVIATLMNHETYLDSLGMLVALLLAGRMLEARGRRRAVEAAVSLAASVPNAARRVTHAGIESVPSTELRGGDTLEVGPGEELAADGIVVRGRGQLQRALLTGEAEPVMVRSGDHVEAGTVLVDGSVRVRVHAVGRETVLSRMAAQLQAAADRGAEPTAADRIAPLFTAATLVIAALTFAGWAWFAGAGVAIPITVAVLVVACPCALALSHPLAAAAGLGAAARRGLLFRSTDALLALEQVDTVALDKTGTVTEGVMAVAGGDDATLRIAAGLERHSIHPIARAIVAETARRGIPLPQAFDVVEQAGVGMEGSVDGTRWRLRSGGAGIVQLDYADGRTRGTIRLSDGVRDDARRTVDALRARGLRVVLLSGDHEDVARRMAAAAGIGEVGAGVSPGGKADWVRARRDEGSRVLFAGDGLNDGPALAVADVGVAMAKGAASSVLVADGVISSAGLTPLVGGFRAARACRAVIRTNLRRSLIYNVAAVGAAVAGLVNPLVAAVLMPLSSGLVIWGAFRVERMVRAEEGAAP
jgi:P-type Cu2+ transporter